MSNYYINDCYLLQFSSSYQLSLYAVVNFPHRQVQVKAVDQIGAIWQEEEALKLHGKWKIRNLLTK